MVRILGLFALWLTLALVFATVVGRHEVDYYRLAKQGLATQGIAVTAKPHNQIEYTFETNRRTYSGIGRISLQGQGVQIGDKLRVYYLPTAPYVNCLGDPQALFSDEMGSVLLVVLLFPTAIILLIVFRGATSGRVSI